MSQDIRTILGAIVSFIVASVSLVDGGDFQESVIADDGSGVSGAATTWTVCSSGCDFTSIQDAVDAASDGDTIELGPETFLENVTVRNRGLTIRGSGSENTIVDGNRQGSVFSVLTNPITLADMTIQNGYSVSGGGVALSSWAIATITDCVIQANEASAGPGLQYGGGGVWYETGSVEIIRSQITYNYSPRGGGIMVSSDRGHSIIELTVVDSLVAFNTGGGGIYSEHDASVRILRSTIAHNTGAGLKLIPGGSSVGLMALTIGNSTIAHNSGHGILAFGDIADRLEVTNSTIAYNAPDISVADRPSSSSHISGTILANTDGQTICNGPLSSEGHNTASDDSCNLTDATDLSNTDPLLGTFGDHGGPTPTIALLANSPAIDSGGGGCPETDQRGVSRPQDGNGDGVARCDIGAYEYETPVIAVGADIKPDGFPNSINPYSRGVIPVAILGSDTFDVADVDVTTLAFGPNAASIAHLNGHLQDVNFDGPMDLVVHFETRDTGIVCGDESATLTGETLDGQAFEGSDSIHTVGCRGGRRSLFDRPGEDRLIQSRGGDATTPQRK